MAILAYIAAIAAALAGVIFIWKKGVKPLAKFIHNVDIMLPLIIELTETFKNTPYAFKILDEIVAQFRTDSGSSLRDAVNRLETAATENRDSAKAAARVADFLRISIEASKKLDQRDRDELRDMLLRLDRVAQAVDAGAATGLRNEAAASVVASDLAAKDKSV
jgi:hypothetical protein